jgi:hypothetical protein
LKAEQLDHRSVVLWENQLAAQMDTLQDLMMAEEMVENLVGSMVEGMVAMMADQLVALTGL